MANTNLMLHAAAHTTTEHGVVYSNTHTATMASGTVDGGGSHLSAGLPMQRSDTWCAWSSRSAMRARACTSSVPKHDSEPGLRAGDG